jgi:hypothetical protein
LECAKALARRISHGRLERAADQGRCCVWLDASASVDEFSKKAFVPPQQPPVRCRASGDARRAGGAQVVSGSGRCFGQMRVCHSPCNRAVSICVGAVLALVLIGCGSGSSGADFVAQGEAICRDAQKTGSSLKKPKTQAELVPFFDRALMLGKDEVGKLSVLHPPADKAGAYRAWIAGLDQAISLLARADAAARSGNVGQVQAIIGEGNALTQTNLADARAVGLLICAKES